MARSNIRCRANVVRIGIHAVGLVLACKSLEGLSAFVAGAARPSTRSTRSLRAQSEPAPTPAPSPSTSTALVQITEDSAITGVSVLGGLLGLLVGGIWIGAAAFAATSYLAKREDDDISKALKGFGTGALEALNFGAATNEKYMVTDKVGEAISSAVDGAKKNPDTKEAVTTLTGAVDTVVDAVKNLDKEVGIKDTVGSLASSATDLSSKAVTKAVELNKEYKVTDQITEKIEEVTKSK
eukprot:CAMPEP_0171099090 /NCGR_PEP_ID=MMETSP0766_2-20121228/50442_1 /TAXON_ID=439317 /ORGANISM="Gambierdiscus australes, Strain CAWD 149" /LENGTH=238 /DNA_ID=CAMNT_0011558617 /DNA_START=41 /DNA_END=757 /DNA_ORIENTATION=+